MPTEPQRPDVSRLVLPRLPEQQNVSPPPREYEPPVGYGPAASEPEDDVRDDDWDKLFEHDLPGLDATPFPDGQLVWPLMQADEYEGSNPFGSSMPALEIVPCPGCGNPLTVAGKSWCLRCGYDSDMVAPQEELDAGSVRQAVVVLLFAAVGCLAIIAATVLRREFVPDRTDLRAWWIFYELAAGFLIYGLGHVTAVALTVRHWADPKPSTLDAFSIWHYALSHLPRTRWAITLGLWGGTAMMCAFILFCLNGYALKDPTAKQKISHSGFPGSPMDDTNDADIRTQSLQGGAVVIGYVPAESDPSRVARLVLGTRDVDGGVHFAGYAEVDPSIDARTHSRLQSLGRPAGTPGYQLDAEVVPVEPNVYVDIRYSAMDGDGVFQNGLVTGLTGGQ